MILSGVTSLPICLRAGSGETNALAKAELVTRTHAIEFKDFVKCIEDELRGLIIRLATRYGTLLPYMTMAYVRTKMNDIIMMRSVLIFPRDVRQITIILGDGIGWTRNTAFTSDENNNSW